MPGAFVAGLFKVEGSLAFIPVLYCDQLHCLHAVGVRLHLVPSAIAHRCECSVLEITKSKIKEIARNEYGGESWNDDLDALTEAADIVADYSKATAQASEMSQKYEQPAMAVRRAAGLYTCPLCGKRTQVGHTHCHWCGKKLSWDRESYADRDYPHMSTKGGRRR